MLEQMREAGLALWFMLGADIVPHRYADDGRLAVGMHQHCQAVIQRELLIGDRYRVDQFRYGAGAAGWALGSVSQRYWPVPHTGVATQ